ncbi:MAG TPA: hypothetical protein VKX39_16065 [Bryobacteraceae bacterium]|nr:hypothetical protein [Bryobacteraceae bacterium]
MCRRILAFLFVAATAFSATIRLYLKDGTYQLAREYQVLQDRVRFYSTERGQWEEIPLDLIDLNRTKKEIAEHEAELQQEAKEQAAEDAAEAEAAREVKLVPPAPGAYHIHGEQMEPIKAAEQKIVGNKRRSVLKALSPVPMITGKETVEIDGDSAAMKISESRPEFFIRLSDEERFGIIKLTPTRKNTRIVEQVDIIPVTKEVMEKHDDVATFKKQEGDLLFKIWPEADLSPGEYAVVEYTDGRMNMQVWDFSVVR